MSEGPAAFFSPGQRKLIGFAVSFAAFLLVLILISLVVRKLGAFVAAFSGVIWPLAVAGILALMLRPVAGTMERRLRVGRLTSTLVIYGIFLLVLSGVLLWILPALVTQGITAIEAFPSYWERAITWMQAHAPQMRDFYDRQMANPAVSGAVEGLLGSAKDWATGLLPNLQAAGGTIFAFFGFLTAAAVVPIYLFFFLQSDEDPTARLGEHLPFIRADLRDDVVFLVREFIGIVVAFFRGQLLIGIIMGLAYALGFMVCGLRFGFALGLGMGLLNVVPYLGSILGLAIGLPLALLQDGGGLSLAGMVLAVFALVQVLEGYVLTPRIMGSQTGLHPVVIIVAIFFWGQALNGILGMVLAIPLTAFFVTAWRLAKRNYFDRLEPKKTPEVG